jgi:hypothetical protein
MPRRHEQHETINLATLDALKLLCDLTVQRRRLIVRKRVAREIN